MRGVNDAARVAGQIAGSTAHPRMSTSVSEMKLLSEWRRLTAMWLNYISNATN
jgi:hypothetical protein